MSSRPRVTRARSRKRGDAAARIAANTEGFSWVRSSSLPQSLQRSPKLKAIQLVKVELKRMGLQLLLAWWADYGRNLAAQTEHQSVRWKGGSKLPLSSVA